MAKNIIGEYMTRYNHSREEGAVTDKWSKAHRTEDYYILKKKITL